MLTPDFQAIAPESTSSPSDMLFYPRGENKGLNQESTVYQSLTADYS